MAGLRRIIALSFVLAIGFLLVILSCALYENWWPLFVVATYILAPLPNAICSRFDHTYDVLSMGNDNQGIVDAGQFITGIFIVTGFCLPSVLAHNEIITYPAMGMSIAGGLLVYGTIIAYTHFFSQQSEDTI
ncbi:vacuolar protein sorting 55 [Mycotypha africana]|uniref:vacuolar protein sorting 55 n=1 Tax=Mycotypha africana TaxID=64632 RepID=UPI002301B8AF|nr:vacuolar protein sorting 55 [Mycotypha africana]KAI8992134.1 vacuolar protein sorting 55 [Mycotypha africana]